MTQILCVRGLPGSGKSTFAAAVASLSKWRHYEADMFFMRNGVYVFEKSQIKAAHQWCKFNTKIALEQGWNVVVANTFTTMGELRPYQELAEDLRVQYNVVTMVGDYGSVHNVPADAIQRMKNRWES